LEPFAPGDAILLRHVWRDEIFLASPVRVVEHTPELLVTWLAPGTPYKRPAVRGELPFGQPLIDRPWRAPGVVQLTRPGDAHSVWVFEHGWYVNLQEPLRRTPLGFDTRDQLLDLVRSPDGRWRWKDEQELADAVRQGFVSADEAAAIRAEGERVIAADVFPTGWEAWKPDPSWAAPGLPAGWDSL
jgi:uncharacterized protein DUF402